MSKLLSELNGRYRQIKHTEWNALYDEFITLESRLRAADELVKALEAILRCSWTDTAMGRLLRAKAQDALAAYERTLYPHAGEDEKAKRFK